MGWSDLDYLWTKIVATPRKPIRGWSAGKALEHVVLRAFELSGARAFWPYSVHLHGETVEQIDGMIVHAGLTCLVEAKDEAGSINVTPLAKLRNQLLRRPAGVIGSVFTSGEFTAPAKTLAHYMAPQAILLWSGPEIGDLIGKRDLAAPLEWKHRMLLQHGMPDYDARSGEPS